MRGEEEREVLTFRTLFLTSYLPSSTSEISCLMAMGEKEREGKDHKPNNNNLIQKVKGYSIASI